MSKIKTKIIPVILASIASFAVFSASRAETLKIGFVSDWEYGKQKEYAHKLPNKAPAYLKAAVNHYNNVFHPDMAVGGGDYILSRSVSSRKAKANLQKINSTFKKVNAPRRYCIGNHDLSHMSKPTVENVLGIDGAHSSSDINGVRVLTLDTNQIARGEDDYGGVGIVSSEELAWMEGQLDTNLPVIVFSHHSPVQTPDGKNWQTNIYAASEVRSVLEKYGNVVAVFSGHRAVNYSTKVNGINYVIINNLSDRGTKGAYADITVEKSGAEVSVSVSQFGKKPATYNFSKTLED